MHAVKSGFHCAELSVAPAGGGEGAEWPHDVAIQLRDEPLTIAGKVVRADGTPVKSAVVWIDDATLFGIK